ncbi:TPA: hypothetical protein ACH3X1_001267 [Trebouxia sp. C0004]
MSPTYAAAVGRKKRSTPLGRIANLAWLRSGAEVLDDNEAPAGSSEDHANENRPNSSPASTSSDSQLPPPLNTEAEWYKGLGDDDEAQYKRQKLLGQQRLCVLIERTLHGQVQIVELLTKLTSSGQAGSSLDEGFDKEVLVTIRASEQIQLHSCSTTCESTALKQTSMFTMRQF